MAGCGAEAEWGIAVFADLRIFMRFNQPQSILANLIMR